MKTGRILVVDDDEDILTAGRLLLRRQFAEVFTCSVPGQIPELLGNHDFDVVLLDMNFGPGESSGQQGLEWLKAILEIDPSLVVIMITAHGSVDTAVEAMRLGATDFVAKPWQNEKIVATVSAGLQLHRSRIEAQSLREANRVLIDAASPRDNAIVGSSSQMQQVLSVVERTAPTDANVLILGENGTGKELIARELHRRSQRADQVFLTVDMGSISETLFESELFGHKKARSLAPTMIVPGVFRRPTAAHFFLMRSATSHCRYKPSCCEYLKNERLRRWARTNLRQLMSASSRQRTSHRAHCVTKTSSDRICCFA